MKREPTQQHVLTTEAPGRIVLGGRAFVQIIEHTVEQELTFAGLIGESRLEQVLMQPEETAETYARRLIFTFAKDAVAASLIACLLVPEEDVKPGQDPAHAWTPATMEETAEFIKHLQAPEDRRMIESLLAAMVSGFFVRGIVSPATSQSSSGRSMTPVPPQSDATASGLSS